jgi:hypothetical protein
MIEQWDVPLLNQIFWEEDVQIIRSMPIYLEMEDIVGWHFDNKRMVWVKSACKVQRACEVRRQRRKIASGAFIGETFWRKLWPLHCPLKINYFLWRLSDNTLAVRKKQQRRGITGSPLARRP